MNPDEKPMPCPFCGNSNPVVESNGIGDYYVACVRYDNDEDAFFGCGARMSDIRCESQEHAIERWNTRAPSPREKKLEEALRDTYPRK